MITKLFVKLQKLYRGTKMALNVLAEPRKKLELERTQSSIMLSPFEL